ncbi:spidroin-1 isoform X1 [Anabrus simplex]|uniref:spidroin-1 isoform X1 n=1 Tax=Anabrus simplex TaxID=316456 RepID=UPI0035A2DE29
MVTATILLLLVGAASTIAFTPPRDVLTRHRRGANDGGKASSGSSSFSSSSSSSSSGSGAGGFGGGGFGGGSGGYPYYPSSNQNFNQGGMPFDYQALFRQFYEHLQRLSQLHSAYTPNIYAASVTSNAGHGHFGWAANVVSPRAHYVQRVPHGSHQTAAPSHRSHLVASPVTYSHSRAHVRVFPGRFGPGFSSNSIDYGYGGGVSGGGFGNPGGYGGQGYQQPNFGQPGGYAGSGFGYQGGQEGYGGHQGFGAPAGYGTRGDFGVPSAGFGAQQGGYGAPAGLGGIQGGYEAPAGHGSSQGGYGGNQGAFVSTSTDGVPGGAAGLDTRGAFAFTGSSSDGDGPVGAQASVSLGTRGGFGQAEYYPPELGSRIGQEIPPPSGGNYAVFSSSSSGSSDVNGKKTSFKQATIGVNDNGKVSTYSVKNP